MIFEHCKSNLDKRLLCCFRSKFCLISTVLYMNVLCFSECRPFSKFDWLSRARQFLNLWETRGHRGAFQVLGRAGNNSASSMGRIGFGQSILFIVYFQNHTSHYIHNLSCFLFCSIGPIGGRSYCADKNTYPHRQNIYSNFFLGSSKRKSWRYKIQPKK